MRSLLFTSLVLTLSATSAQGQSATWELSALAGYVLPVELERQADEVDATRIGGGVTWSFQAARFFTENLAAEVSWTDQPSSAYEVEVGGVTSEFFAMSIGHLDGSVVYEFGAADARLRPFVFGGLGATFFRARDIPMETKLSAGLGGGAKLFPWPNIGLRAQIRYRPIWMNDEDSLTFCDPFGFCQSTLRQFEFAGGVTFRF
jgi:opacity protein-like surface antigen